MRFLKCPSDSIDYAVMEGAGSTVVGGKDGTKGYAVVPIDVGWSDIGSWSTLWKQREQDDMGNVLQGDVFTEATKNSLIVGGHRLVAAIGLEDVVVIETPDAVLVAHKDRVQDIKGIVEHLREQGRSEADIHRKYTVLGILRCTRCGRRVPGQAPDGFPGCVGVLQFHRHRAEHWIVVRGTAKVTKGGEIFLLGETSRSPFLKA